MVPAISIDSLDHLVLTVLSVEASVAFYTRVLGMTEVTFGEGRKALAFGRQKINLHATEKLRPPVALMPVPGSADLCLLTRTPLHDVIRHLRDCGVEILEGPVRRAGARAPLDSVYIRDPDGNLLEIAHERTDV